MEAHESKHEYTEQYCDKCNNNAPPPLFKRHFPDIPRIWMSSPLINMSLQCIVVV